MEMLACRYVLHVPDNLAFEGVAPLLCAGITTYSPLRHYGFDKPGFKLGIVGLGGLGHMGVLQGVLQSCNANARSWTWVISTVVTPVLDYLKMLPGPEQAGQATCTPHELTLAA